MYILSSRPINFSFRCGYGSISSDRGRRLSSNNCSSRIWKNGRREVVPHMKNYGICGKDLINAARRGKSNLPQVCSGDIGGSEVQPINEKSKIEYGLETPWYASLPGLDARFFIEHYGVDDRVWIGKSLCRLPEIEKDTHLELAKLDFNRCQEQHRMEWNHIQQWYEDCNLEEFGISKKKILESHFFAVASIFEAERKGERLAWVKSQILAHILSTYYYIKQCDQSSDEFSTSLTTKIHVGGLCGKGFKNVQRIIAILFEALTQFKKIARERSDGDISDDLLHEAWGGWLKKLGEGIEEEMQEVELIVRSINICGGHILSKEVLSHHEYKTLSQLTNRICHHLQKLQYDDDHKVIDMEIEKEMQLLVQLVVQDSSNGISKAIKQTFLVVAKAFYHRDYFSAHQIEKHISMILFEQVV